MEELGFFFQLLILLFFVLSQIESLGEDYYVFQVNIFNNRILTKLFQCEIYKYFWKSTWARIDKSDVPPTLMTIDYFNLTKFHLDRSMTPTQVGSIVSSLFLESNISVFNYYFNYYFSLMDTNLESLYLLDVLNILPEEIHNFFDVRAFQTWNFWMYSRFCTPFFFQLQFCLSNSTFYSQQYAQSDLERFRSKNNDWKDHSYFISVLFNSFSSKN